MKLIPKYLTPAGPIGWVKDRDINGNWGYRNLKTGLFRTHLPNSSEEKEAELKRHNKAVLSTHAAAKAKFDEAVEKLRNHSDETFKKDITVPILVADKDGNFHNTTYTTLAPGEDSAQINTFIEELIPVVKSLKLVTGLGKLLLAKTGQNAASHWARNSLLNEATGGLTRAISNDAVANTARNLSAKYTTLERPLGIASTTYWKPTRASWNTGRAEGNEATSYYLRKSPDLKFELVKDVEPNNYSIHFKTDLNGLSYGDKMLLFAKVADEIPEGASVSTWGTISKGGVHGINRFGQDFGFTRTGSRELTMKGTGEPVEVGVYTKLNKEVLEFLKSPNILNLISKTLGNPELLKKALVHNLIVKSADKDVSNLFKDYASQLSEINPAFNNRHFISNFKIFLHNKGYRADLSNEEIVKIITDNYNKLRSTNEGLMKDRVFWNGSAARYIVNSSGEKEFITKAAPESFTKINVWDRTSPTDAEGIYFGRLPFYLYSYPREYYGSLTHRNYMLGDDGYDMQPYLLLITGPIVESSGQNLGKGSLAYNFGFRGNKAAFLAELGTAPWFTNGEYRIGYDTPLKSLYPHPESLVRGSDGKIYLNRSWSNPEIHKSIIPIGISLPFLNNKEE